MLSTRYELVHTIVGHDESYVRVVRVAKRHDAQEMQVADLPRAARTFWSAADREFEETSDRYIAQVRIYSQAVGEATNAPTRGVLLVV